MALEGRLDVDVGRDVAFAFTVSNAGTEPAALHFESGQLADVAVYDGDEEMWRWSDGRAFTQALGSQTLLPGESFTHEAVWRVREPGEYRAVATIAATDCDVEASATFVV